MCFRLGFLRCYLFIQTHKYVQWQTQHKYYPVSSLLIIQFFTLATGVLHYSYITHIRENSFGPGVLCTLQSVPGTPLMPIDHPVAPRSEYRLIRRILRVKHIYRAIEDGCR